MTSEYFDQWYADIAASAARQRLFTRYLGVPPEVGPSNLLPLAGLETVAATLALPRGARLVDLACGRGGPGMWIAREAGAELTGVDFSPGAVELATRRRGLFGLEGSATFLVGSIEDTGLPTGSADAVVCVDAFQFAADGVRAAEEVRRVLRSGGRVVLTSWEAVDGTDESVSERIRRVDLAGWLRAAGFREVMSEVHPEWHEVARVLWETALEMDEDDDPALASTRAEARRSLDGHDRLRRVMATAVAP